MFFNLYLKIKQRVQNKFSCPQYLYKPISDNWQTQLSSDKGYIDYTNKDKQESHHYTFGNCSCQSKKYLK